MSLRAPFGSRLGSAAIVSLRASRRYVAVVSLGVTLIPLVSLAAQESPFAPLRADAPALRTSAPVHDLHLTFSRVEVIGSRIRWRVRLFRDDLEKSMREYAHQSALEASSPAADSVFSAYFNAHVQISALGTPLSGAVIDSGRDPESPEPQMWWYLVELHAQAPIRALAIRVGFLFEHFADQRNIVTVTRGPGGQRRSLYFARGDSAMKTVF